MSWCSFVILKRVNSLSSYSLIKTKQVLVEFWSRDRILKIQKHIIFPAVPIPSIAISSSYHQRINLIQKGFNLNAIRFLAETFQQFSKIFTIISISFCPKYILKTPTSQIYFKYILKTSFILHVLIGWTVLLKVVIINQAIHCF